MAKIVKRELRELAAILAKWSRDYEVQVYIFGSRVRGDEVDSSDVDVCIEFEMSAGDEEANQKTIDWWTRENRENFRAINKCLPGELQVLAPNDPVREEVISGRLVHQNGNVRCIWLPRKKPKRSP
jgi:predicted nucleotidyltransferase